jgi:hypothetical protein
MHHRPSDRPAAALNTPPPQELTMRRALALAHARAAQPPPHAARVRACACACADDALVGDRAVAALVASAAAAADGEDSDALPVLTVLQKALW